MLGKVLVVSEDAPLAERIRNHLSEKKFSVNVVRCPREALAIAEQNDIDVVVLNLKDLMEEGIMLLQRLKKSQPLVQVVTLSIPDVLRFSIQSMKLGAFADVFMPFNLEELTANILEAWQAAKKKKRSLRYRLENLAVSVSFAEAGDFSTALTVAKETPGQKRDDGRGGKTG